MLWLTEETSTPRPKSKPPASTITASEDKINWTKRLISDKIKINICYRAEKANFCTGADCILIDDYDKNIREWEALGGTGILYTNIEDVKNALNKIL